MDLQYQQREMGMGLRSRARIWTGVPKGSMGFYKEVFDG
jgi:hypothetical protein